MTAHCFTCACAKNLVKHQKVVFDRLKILTVSQIKQLTKRFLLQIDLSTFDFEWNLFCIKTVPLKFLESSIKKIEICFYIDHTCLSQFYGKNN